MAVNIVWPVKKLLELAVGPILRTVWLRGEGAGDETLHYRGSDSLLAFRFNRPGSFAIAITQLCSVF
jgi:hypothetical protein